MTKGYLSVLVFLFFSFQQEVFSQRAKTHVLTADEAKIVRKDAATMFSSEDYRGALDAYRDLYKSAPNNVDFNFKLGLCYIETNVNKREAVKYLKFACESKEAKKEWLYYLGIAYMYNEQWDEAIETFREYQQSKSKPGKDFMTPDRLIEMCENANELSSRPINCTYTNLGKTVNSPFDEYNPFITADGLSLIYSARRKGNMGGFIEDLGIYTADIFSSYWKDTIWSKARSMGANVNSEWDEESVGLSSTGDQVLIYNDNALAFGDISIATLRGKLWQRPLLLSEQINTKQEENGACMTADGNTIYFSSNRKESNGGFDLFVISRNEAGDWGMPINLGLDVNTAYDDINPYLSTDEKKLFFASKGWTSMGGFDLFYCEWNDSENKWGKPKNLGYPLNNSEDNMFISFTGDERFAFVSAVRPEGFGDRDIYMVEFNDTSHHPLKHVITGNVNGRVEVTKVTLENKQTGKIIETHPSSTLNQFAFAIGPGEYTLHVEGYKFIPYSEDITVGNEFPPELIAKTIEVQKTK